VFIHLPVESVRKLLSQSQLRVVSENCVYVAVTTWISAQLRAREEECEEMEAAAAAVAPGRKRAGDCSSRGDTGHGTRAVAPGLRQGTASAGGCVAAARPSSGADSAEPGIAVAAGTSGVSARSGSSHAHLIVDSTAPPLAPDRDPVVAPMDAQDGPLAVAAPAAAAAVEVFSGSAAASGSSGPKMLRQATHQVWGGFWACLFCSPGVISFVAAQGTSFSCFTRCGYRYWWVDADFLLFPMFVLLWLQLLSCPNLRGNQGVSISHYPRHIHPRKRAQFPILDNRGSFAVCPHVTSIRAKGVIWS